MQKQVFCGVSGVCPLSPYTHINLTKDRGGVQEPILS